MRVSKRDISGHRGELYWVTGNSHMRFKCECGWESEPLKSEDGVDRLCELYDGHLNGQN